ncbi:Fe-S cluster assembly protein SufD [Jonesiaceae bacterium BS-20]|uniref:Fe-S cluster assembly protein SufD n=1 Tax=Jonesiaceae bacterium BS-20 TaxID=3120821 RepID=A0AAU7DWX8_9MICO
MTATVTSSDVENQGLSTDHSKATADGAHTHGVPTVAGSRADRIASFDPTVITVPNGREEEWRFSPVAKLAPLFETDLAADGVTIAVDAAPEVTVETVDRTDARLGKSGVPGDRTAVAAWNAFDKATVLTVPRNAVASKETSVLFTGASDAPTASHLLIEAGESSQALFIIDHTGDARLNQTVEIIAGDNANITVVSVQDWDEKTVHAASHRVRLGRDAHVKHVVVTFGGDVVRITPDAEFTGAGGDLEMVGLYFADTGQHQEHRLFVDHAVPNCKSRVTYKGAVQGQDAHVVWIGDVLIRANASGTDTYEMNRNLILTDGGRADSVPNLEIETGEIEGAGHASTTGRFDDEQLFYLMARGISEGEARRLVVRGFFAELIQEIGVPAVEERLINSIDRELEKSMSVIQGTGPAA